MTPIRTLLISAALAAGVIAHASDRVAVYTRVDRVTLEPSGETPERIQIWGVFSIAQPNDPNDYRPAARGYLYYKLPANRDAARREWSDLKSVAGTGQLVAFGSRWEGVPRLRSENEPPANPDAYSLNAGVVKISDRTDYAPIRSVLDLAR